MTEYGVAELCRRTIRQRTEALIGIAHPSLRDQPRGATRKLGYL
jgi:acyl-CoA hydrolase